MGRVVLITGGAGFVGRHFCEYFLRSGDRVVVVDNLVKGTGGQSPKSWYFNPYTYKKFTFVHKDCRVYFQEKRNPPFDYVLHLAAMVGGRLMIEKSPLTVADDLSIDSHFWQWALRTKPRKVITFSSSAVYPVALQQKKSHVLLQEEMVSFTSALGVPDLTYGWAKLTSEYLGKIAYSNYGIQSVVYRPFSGYGKDQDVTYPFPSIMKRIRSARDGRIRIWGTGRQQRDFIHIDDCVRGVVSTMDRINNGDALNLSTGIPTSFRDLVHLAGSVTGKILRVDPVIDKPEGVFSRVGDTNKQRVYGFVASISLKDTLRRIL